MTAAITRTIEELKEREREEGMKEGAYKIAKRLLSKGVDVETIAESTELSIEEIRNLD